MRQRRQKIKQQVRAPDNPSSFLTGQDIALFGAGLFVAVGGGLYIAKNMLQPQPSSSITDRRHPPPSPAAVAAAAAAAAAWRHGTLPAAASAAPAAGRRDVVDGIEFVPAAIAHDDADSGRSHYSDARSDGTDGGREVREGHLVADDADIERHAETLAREDQAEQYLDVFRKVLKELIDEEDADTDKKQRLENILKEAQTIPTEITKMSIDSSDLEKQMRDLILRKVNK
jgi:hypothetical protein